MSPEALALRIRIYSGLLVKLAGRSREEAVSRLLPGMTGLQLGVLQTLSHEELALKDLAGRMMIKAATLVPVVEKLVRAGYLVRQPIENDRRSYLLQVTQDGFDLVRRAARLEKKDALLGVVNTLGIRKAELLVSLLEGAVDALSPGEGIVASVDETLAGHEASTGRRRRGR